MTRAGEGLVVRTDADLDKPIHVVQFYEDDAPLVEAIARFVGAGLGAGDAAVVIATERHLASLEELLAARGLDLATARAERRYVSFDAAQTLATFLRDGWPEETRFLEVIGGMIEAATAGGSLRVRAFGEMVSVLWAEGRRAAAIRLEQLWSDLARKVPFSLLCAYPMNGFAGETDEGPFLGICEAHTHVVPAEGFARFDASEDRRRAIARLQQRAIALESDIQPRLAAIVESSDDAIVGKTLDGIVTSWNRGAERLFGYTEAEMIGRSLSVLVPPERSDDLPRILDAIRRGERVDHFETERVRKDGERLHVSVTVSPIRDSSGRIIGASKIARDVTERKRAEEERKQLLEAEQKARRDAEAASRAKDDFLATVSHELRTPLSPILTWTRILKTGGLDADKARRALDSIERSARTQAQLVEDLLDISRIISGKLRLDVRPVRLATVIDAAIEVIRPAADAKGVELQVILDRDVGPVSGDAERLQQVVWNLLSNAVKFTPKDGRVTVLLERDNEDLRVTVRDTGTGIRPEFLPHVFERFRQADIGPTRAHGGLGLGLAIVRHMVEAHGGTVEVESEGEGRGTAFSVRLPLLRPRAPETSDRRDRTRPANDPFPSLAGVSLLVVDDEPDSNEAVRELLALCGADVRVAGSAKHAREILRRWKPDVLVSDVAMPGEDGYAFIADLRSHNGDAAQLPALALTAYASRSDKIRLLAAGFQAHVSKPLDPTELIRVVLSLARPSERV